MEEDTKLTKKEKRALAKEEKRKLREKKEAAGKLRKWLVLVLVALTLVFGGYKIWKWINTPTDDSQETLTVSEGDHIEGRMDAPITIVEYSDFQCPACSNYSSILNDVIEKNSNVRLVYRHFPLTQIHKNSLDAAKGAEAAGLQNKFWEMHDLLFERQIEWEDLDNPEEKFFEYASELDLDQDKYKGDYESDEVESRVYANLSQANQMKLNSTPTFFVNGEKTKLPGSVEGIIDALDNFK